MLYFVGFTSATFSGSEGSTSSVSLFVSPAAPFDISLTLQAMDITATCKRLTFYSYYVFMDVFITLVGADYFFNAGSIDRNVTVTIPMGSTTHDIGFTIRNDRIIELDETFQLQIMLSAQSTARDVLLAGGAAIVTLEDSRTFSKFIALKPSFLTRRMLAKPARLVS